MHRHVLIAAAVLATLLGISCHNGPRNIEVSSTRFEVATGSVVLGARQLLVDTSNGDVWILEGTRPGVAQWALLARGPEDARESEPLAVELLEELE